MAVRLWADNAIATLASGISNSATSIPLATGKGALFPSPSGGDYFMLTLTQAGSETSWETVKVTARSGDTLTAVRGAESTSAASWSSADKAELRITKGLFTDVAISGGTVGGLATAIAVADGGTGGTSAYAARSNLGVPALSGGNTISGTQVMSDAQVTRAMLIDCGFTYLDKGNSSTTTQTLDYTAGSHQKITATGNHTIATSNWPPSGNLGELLLELANGGAYTITWPTINWIKPDGTTTTSISTYLAANTGRTALQTSGTDFILLWSRDAGTTIYGKLI